jgi:DNA polymerase I-like protein with 3'-5' exonuclease and polymerase domains
MLLYALSQDFIARVKADFRRVGYVETLLGRRRYLPAINSCDTEAR